VGNHLLSTLFHDGLHNRGRFGWSDTKTSLHRPNVKSAAHADQIPTPDQARQRLVYGRTGSKMQEFLRRERHSFRSIADVIDHGCSKRFHTCQKYSMLYDTASTANTFCMQNQLNTVGL